MLTGRADPVARRWAWVLVILAAVIPLLWPDIPPLTDLPGHMGRYRIDLDAGRHPWLLHFYTYRRSLIGNMGVDLLVRPVAAAIGLEPAVKLIVMLVVASTVGGLLWLSREVHGRIPAGTVFALPLVYSFPFQFGFLNYLLSVAIALNLGALWLRLGRQGHVAGRALLFVPASVLLWGCHVFGWVILGAIAGAAEITGARSPRRTFIMAVWRGALACLPLALPLLLLVLWRQGDDVAGATRTWFAWRDKAKWAAMVLRDHWRTFDLLSAGLLYAVLLDGVRHPVVRFAPALGLAAALLGTAYLVMPSIIFGSFYADMRLAPVALMLGLVALRPRPRGEVWLTAAAILFATVRLVAATASYGLLDRGYDRALAALPHVPLGATVVSFVGRPCGSDRWASPRLEHLPSLLIVRRLAFANDQWALGGAQPLIARYRQAGAFRQEPSQLVYDPRCHRGATMPAGSGRPIGQALRDFPRAAFDYVWLLDPPPYPLGAVRDLRPVWRDDHDVLFAVVGSRSATKQ